MSFFTVGKPFMSGVGDIHSMAMEDAGMTPPVVAGPTHDRQRQLTDAVIAASKVLNSAKTDSSVMGESERQAGATDVDKIMKVTISSALDHEREIGDARLIRLALFAHEWLDFRQALALKALVDQIMVQRTNEFRARANAWAEEIHGAVNRQPSTALATRSLPWRRIFIGTGILAAILLGLKMFASFRDEDATPVPRGPRPKYVFNEETPATPTATPS